MEDRFLMLFLSVSLARRMTKQIDTSVQSKSILPFFRCVDGIGYRDCLCLLRIFISLCAIHKICGSLVVWNRIIRFLTKISRGMQWN